MIVKKTVFGRAGKGLKPFPKEVLKGYHLPNDAREVDILSGVVKSVNGGVVVLKCGDEEAKIDTKKDVVCVGDKITVIMSGDECKKVTFGPFFGEKRFQLLFGDDKKSATEFVLKSA